MKEKWEAARKIFDLVERVEVTFTKKNGEERKMLCTRSMYLIPDEHKPKGNLQREPNYEALPVYDLEKLAWRSFRIDSIINIKPLL
jgi:hypothetical protein